MLPKPVTAVADVTVAVGGDVAEPEPLEFVPVTTIWTVLPTSKLVTT